VDLSIIIVNWKSVAYLRQCLLSIYANATDLKLEVIVVDNASGDDCCEIISREFPAVTCIGSPVNLGFAGANNLGFDQAHGRNVLHLNPDTEIVGAALRTLVSSLDTIPDAAVVGAKLLNTDGTIQDSCIQSFPTILNQAFDVDALRIRFPSLWLWGTRPLHAKHGAPTPVEVVSGACMMLKRQAFESVGGFSTDYFMYSEDVDLCWRTRKAGWQNYYVAPATVVHHGGCSSSKETRDNFAAIVMRESRLKFFRTWRGRPYAVAYRISIVVSAIARLAALKLAGLFILNSETDRLRIRDSLRKWKGILRWAIGFERWTDNLIKSSRAA
jgi:GT2 family glycosyltransferase